MVRIKKRLPYKYDYATLESPEDKRGRMTTFCHDPYMLKFLHFEAERLKLQYPTHLLQRIIAEYSCLVETINPHARDLQEFYIFRQKTREKNKSHKLRPQDKYLFKQYQEKMRDLENNTQTQENPTNDPDNEL